MAPRERARVVFTFYCIYSFIPLQIFIEDLQNAKHSAIPYAEGKYEIEIGSSLKKLSAKELR